jgi:Rod binding domain-containing protein
MNFGISAYTNIAQISADASTAAAPRALGAAGKTASANSASADSASQEAQLRKLKNAATQFEAMLLEKWWSAMKESGFGDNDDGDPGQGTLDNMGMQAMSMAVASAGGIGIAAMLVHSVQGELAAENTSKASGAGASQKQAGIDKSQ